MSDSTAISKACTSSNIVCHRGGSRIFLRKGCTYFFFGRIPVVLESRPVISEGGGGGGGGGAHSLHPPPRSALVSSGVISSMIYISYMIFYPFPLYKVSKWRSISGMCFDIAEASS